MEQFSAVPYLATLFNCGMWVLYGLPRFHKDALLVLTINGTGFGIELIYLTLFLLYSDRKQRVKVGVIVVAELAVIVVIGLLVSSFVHNIDHRTTIIGSICMLGNILMYASPLSIMVFHFSSPYLYPINFPPLFLYYFYYDISFSFICSHLLFFMYYFCCRKSNDIYGERERMECI